MNFVANGKIDIKRNKVELLIEQKKEIFEYYVKNSKEIKLTYQSVQSHFIEKFQTNIGRITIGDIIWNKEKYLYCKDENLEKTRIRFPEHRELEEA